MRSTWAETQKWRLHNLVQGRRVGTYTFANAILVGEVGRFRYLWDVRDAQGNTVPPGIYEYKVKFSIPYRAQYCGASGLIFGNPPDCIHFPTHRYVGLNSLSLKAQVAEKQRTLVDNFEFLTTYGLASADRNIPRRNVDISIAAAKPQLIARPNNATNGFLEQHEQSSISEKHITSPQEHGLSSASPITSSSTLASGPTTDVCGTISVNTTWTLAGSPYVMIHYWKCTGMA